MMNKNGCSLTAQCNFRTAAAMYCELGYQLAFKASTFPLICQFCNLLIAYSENKIPYSADI